MDTIYNSELVWEDISDNVKALTSLITKNYHSEFFIEGNAFVEGDIYVTENKHLYVDVIYPYTTEILISQPISVNYTLTANQLLTSTLFLNIIIINHLI